MRLKETGVSCLIKGVEIMAKLERTDKPVSVLIEELGEGALGLPEIQS